MLETKVPPPIVAVVVGVGMWLISTVAPQAAPAAVPRLIAALGIALIGGAAAASGAAAFRKAQTTVSPLYPERASAFVSNGIYRFTRNPMYLGLLLVLFGVAIFLWSLPALIGLPAFIGYIWRFQIVPEERVLEQMFGAQYVEYKRRVRRWL
jgi:protein-S-isoprenylcysteine O-methyltransferase Ste14